MEMLKEKSWCYMAKPKQHNGEEMYFIEFREYNQTNKNWIIKGLYWALNKESAKEYIESLVNFDKLSFENLKIKNSDTQNWIIRELEKGDTNND